MDFSGIGNRRRALARTLAVGVAFGLAAGPALAQYGAPAQSPQQQDTRGKQDKAAKPAKGAKAAPGYSKEFVAVAGPLQTKLEAARAAKARADAGVAAAKAELDAALAGAPAMLTAAEAAAKTPTERAAAGQFAVTLGNFTKDPAMQQRGIQALVASGVLDPAKQAEMQVILGKIAYGNKDYRAAQAAFAAAVASGYAGDDAVEILADSYAQTGNAQGGLAEVRKAINARRSAGKPVPASWLKRANVIAYNAKLGAEAMEFATIQAELNPSNFNWLNAAQNVRSFANYQPTENIDLFRLMMRSGAFDNETRFTANEYKEYIETADPRRLPGETLKVIDKGVSTGALNASTAWVAAARTTASGRMAADKASLTAAARDARNKATGVDALSIADAYLNYGEAVQAEELYKLALQKGGVDKDRALTRLGIAQFDQGKYAEARDNFSKVAGARLPLARLWLVLTNQKSPGSTPTRAS